MSHKFSLSDLLAGISSDAEGSLTARLAHAFIAAIEDGMLEPGAKLPPTRQLAEAAGVNHLTAARVYKRLAEDGYVSAQVGRGTFVRLRAAAVAAEPDSDDWQQYVLPDRQSSYAQQIHLEAYHNPYEPEVLALGVGWPSPGTLPTDDLARIAADVFREEGGNALDYLSAEGLPALREEVAARGREAGFATDAEEIIVTSGARQGIDLAVRALVQPGDVVAIESPTFTGALASLHAAGARVIGVPFDDDGLEVEALERVIARHEIKLLFVQSACQNPTGRDLPADRRARLVELARERSFFIVDDGVYATLRYEGDPFPRLRAGAPAHVIYVDSLSKTVGGGLRIGWIAASGPVRSRLAGLKVESDVHTSSLDQHIAVRYLASGAHERQLARVMPYYRERRDAMLDALATHLGGEYTAPHPLGGHHVWVTLNRRLDEQALRTEALRHGVAYIPGAAAVAQPTGRTSMRLSFPLLDPDELHEAVRRLARATETVRRRSGLAATAAPS
ncbi:MAG TPA: PLP-dependent aminotransferase family protein [Solirubrobacteraceae bacterium]|jgi:2-aminoadipate transaminase|nr:PLP-dependent aminotransferase family protein [Solirubrobacteraceae bacterium]